MKYEVSGNDLFEKLLYDDEISSFAMAEKLRQEKDPKYKDMSRPLTFTERRARLDKEQKERAERIRQAITMELPLGHENHYEYDSRIEGVYYDCVPDALVHCYRTLGFVDIEYISAITKKTYKEVIESLSGAIFQNPEKWEECFFKGWEMAEEYLSGNLIRKYLVAKRANHIYNDRFQNNLSAIELILPQEILSEEIYVHPGSPWLPSDVHNEFIKHVFGKPIKPYNFDFQVKHDEKTGTWDVPAKALYRNNPEVYSKYGTRRMDALEIYERTLNGAPIKVTDEVPDPKDRWKTRRVINQSETLLAIEKQKLLAQTFQDWIWTDTQRKQRLQMIFAEKYGCYRRRKFDGAFLTLPGLNPDIQLYPYQKDAVARIIFSPNVLLAHDVGSGKTYEMIVAGMELKRMKLSQKNLYVVPNNILGQWEELFHLLYKDAKTLFITPKMFTPEKRDEVLIAIKDNDYDAIIMPYSVFDKIPVSKRWVCERFLEEEEELGKIAKNWEQNTSGIRKAQKNLKNDTRKLLEKIEKFKMALAFDELGITRLFIDEAHNYKNVPIETRSSGIRGINNVGSLKCEMMLEKVRYIQKTNKGGGIVMATGTPLTNSLTDAFVMQNYLQSGELALLDIQTFDAWVGMFAEASSEFEIDVDTNSYRLATRLSQFHNMNEMTALLSSIADFHSMEKGENIPEFNGYTDHLIPRTQALKAYLKDISRRADDIHKGRVGRNVDNMLLLTVDGRKAALDIRLINSALSFSEKSKVFVCAETVSRIYFQTQEEKLTQLVFCDMSTPSEKFNMYEELARILVSLGVSREEIAFVHDAKTEKQRDKLFDKVRKGAIRILIGSTFKLGMGVNVQDKLIAVHHLDVPWRPSDMVQRQGRILRQGNTNKEVFIHRYITEGSFDAYSWQLLEMKQRFINAILSGSVTDKDSKDIDDTVLDYAEVKALAVGNPLIKERVEIANELSRYRTLQRKTLEERELLSKELMEIPAQRVYYLECIKEAQEDDAFVKSSQEKQTPELRKDVREKLFAAITKNVFETSDTFFMNYRGFDIILPSHMSLDKPYIWLQRCGRYCIDMSDNEKGNLVRIDNCIDGLSQRISRFYERLQEIRCRQESIESQLKKEENYKQQIKDCKMRLKKIDEELGVK